MGSPATDLLALGEGVEWTSFEAAAAAHDAVDPRYGRLGELVEWLAGAQDAADPRPPARPRCVVFGTAGEAARALAAALDVGLREVRLDPAATVPDALAQGVAAADDEVDAGADLIVVVDADDSAASALSVSLLAGAEPVALLPRGAAAIDTAAWIARAEYLRDARRAVAGLRDDPAELLAALGHAPLAATGGFVLRATARRTPLVLDGPTAAAAALACHHVQPRSAAGGASPTPPPTRCTRGCSPSWASGRCSTSRSRPATARPACSPCRCCAPPSAATRSRAMSEPEPPPRRAADAVTWPVRVAAAWTWRLLVIGVGLYVARRRSSSASSWSRSPSSSRCSSPRSCTRWSVRCAGCPARGRCRPRWPCSSGSLVLAGIGCVRHVADQRALRRSWATRSPSFVDKIRDWLRTGPLHLKSADLDKIADEHHRRRSRPTRAS